MFPEHMLSVRATVEPGRETEFNRWYDNEHVPDARADGSWLHRRRALQGRPGRWHPPVHGPRRLRERGQARGRAPGPEIKELIKIYDRDVGAFSTRTRPTYERVLLHVKAS